MQDPSRLLWSRLAGLVADGLERARQAHLEQRDNLALLTRLTAHLGIIALVIFALLLSGIEIRAGDADAQPESGADSALPAPSLGQTNGATDLTLAAVPFTIQLEPKRVRNEVVEYTVRPGDNVSVIAARFSVSPDSILWANGKLEDNPDWLSVGQILNIPPVTGVLYTVAKGDNVQAIAARFKAKVEDILTDSFNQSIHDLKANPPQLQVGQFIMVPGGEKPYVARKVIYSATTPAGAAKGTSNFIWPTSGCISQYFWQRHTGIDIATANGTAVVAADSGFVQQVGWDNTGYGNMILINHGNGYVTRYAHLSAFNVQAGQSVRRGDLIGRIGSTGRSTGPHLHFEVIDKGVHRNPSFFVAGRAPGSCYR